MFVQIHMLQSMPPGNLNRDDTGQPKKCIFGGVTRGRISSQCLKRNIRHSTQFKDAFGEDLADRTTYLPRMVADELKKAAPEVSEDELNKVKIALAKKFKAEKRGDSENTQEDSEAQVESESSSSARDAADQTGQLVFFPPPFAKEIASLVLALRKEEEPVFLAWVGGKKKGIDKHKEAIKRFEDGISKASKTLTVDIGLFGRMTTSDLVVNVEAACQVAHAISTHETIIESDYFTAMDDKKKDFAPTQTEQTGAAFLGSGETETFFDAAVYYKYFNLDIDALKTHLNWQNDETGRAARVLVEAAALVNPTGKQNGFASHGAPHLILLEITGVKRPISYANAFLEPVEGPKQMAQSARALKDYVETVAVAFQPPAIRRLLLAVGHASVDIAGADRATTLGDLLDKFVNALRESAG